MNKSKTQKEFVKSWVKIMLNSSYGFPPIPVIPMEYDKDKKLQITEEGKKKLMMLQEELKMFYNGCKYETL